MRSRVEPVVSVVVVSYNHARFVEEALESLLKQSFTNWELIVADDASKDNSVEIINNWLEHKEIKAKKLFHKKNTGFCTILNESIELCAGEYIKIIAADDVMHQDLLLKSLSFFHSNSADYGMVYSNAAYIDENSKVLNRLYIENNNYPEGWVIEDLFKSNFIPALSAVIKKEVFSRVGKYDTSILIEDYDMWMRLAKEYKIGAIPEVLSFYRVHGDNISLKHDMEIDVMRILIKHDPDLQYRDLVNRRVRDFYYMNKVSNEFISVYKHYKGKEKLMLHFMKRLPYRAYRVASTLLAFGKHKNYSYSHQSLL